MTAQEAITSLLEQRGVGKTICPSEAARQLAGDSGDWRAAMPLVHEATARLADQGVVTLSWKGTSLSQPCGPYRIGPA